MEKVTKEEFNYFLDKIDFSKTNLDAKAIEIMNRLDTLFNNDCLDEKLSKYFNKIELSSLDELDEKCKEYDIETIAEGATAYKLRTLAGAMFRNISDEPRLFHLKTQRFNDKLMEELVYVDDFIQNKTYQNIYTWMNGNTSAFFIIEFIN